MSKLLEVVKMFSLSYIERLYSLDTLDTRFTVSANAALKKTSKEHGVTVDNPALSAAGQPVKQQDQELPVGIQPSKWRTPEYIFYYIVIIVVLPSMFGVVINVSKGDTICLLRSFLIMC